jgi:hypothetical protein
MPTPSPRLLWLGFERPPHPDAVCHAATSADVDFVLEWLEQPESARQRIAQQLRRYVDDQSHLCLWQRPSIPCRRPAGLYVLLPWRLAKWLSCILPATPTAIDRTRRRLEAWLQHNTGNVVNPIS